MNTAVSGDSAPQRCQSPRSPHSTPPRQRSQLVTRLPRQPDMDEDSPHSPVPARKTPEIAADPNRRRSFSDDSWVNMPFAANHGDSPRSPRDEVIRRRPSPPPPVRSMQSPRRALSSPPALHTGGGDPSEEESIALARMLMAQEAMESYALSADYLRYNAAQYSQEDLQALQAVLQEEEGDFEDGEEEGNDMQYEMMLQLGEAIGDVKKERWAMVADQHIARLPTSKFVQTAESRKLGENDSRRKCLVCQFDYENGDHLRKLPCGHCFHIDCVDPWLKEHDCCGYCRKSIVPTKM